LLFWYGSTLLVHGEYTIIKFFVCVMAVTFAAQGAGQFFSFAPDITKAISATLNVTRLLNHIPDIDVWNGGGKRATLSGNIQFKNVHFNYPTRPDVPVLRGLNLNIQAGQYAALVGESGCGKSTTVGLIERFYDPVAGEVTVDGVPISEYNLADYRSQISIVSQEPTLYQGTIRFNILLGADGASQEEIDQAAKAANVISKTRSLLT
jgi:ATP-binding cassette, subfamily B (MDR/TAP), member 1